MWMHHHHQVIRRFNIIYLAQCLQWAHHFLCSRYTLQFRGWSSGWTTSIGGIFYSLIIIIIICGHLTMMNLCTWYASQGAAVRCAICSGRATRGIYNWCVVVDRKSCWGVFCYGWWMCQGNARNIKNIEIHRSVVFAVPLSILHEQSHHQEVANLIVPPIHTHVVHAFCLAFLALKHVQICLVSSMYLSWRSGTRRITSWWRSLRAQIEASFLFDSRYGFICHQQCPI